MIAPVTIGWGWLVSALFVVAFVERSPAFTALACGLALFSRETTLIFALIMFVALFLAEGDRSRGVVVSLLLLAGSCLLYLVLRLGWTMGYEHQIDSRLIAARLGSLSFSDHFFIQLLLGQGMLVLLLLGIALKRPRYAIYLFAGAATMAVVALATGVTDVGLLVGETLPFYAAIFLLAWNGVLPARLSSKAAIVHASGA